MTGRRRGPAPHRTGPQEAPSQVLQAPSQVLQHQRSADPQVASGELLRRLADPILTAADPTDATARLGESAGAAAVLIASGRLERLAVAVVLTTTAQAAGVPLADAEGVVRAALSGGPR